MSQLLSILKKAGEFLHEKGSPSARLDAEVLLASVLSMQRIELYANYDRPLNNQELNRYRELVARRAKLEPIAYILGHKEFYSRDFYITRDCLIPRPETELLVEKVLGYTKSFSLEKPEILDLCTGSGVIAITLSLELENLRVLATDISQEALKVAKHNAELLKANVDFLESDLYPNIEQKFDIIVSNPPYISTSEWETLEPNVKLYEPRIALDAGPDGLDFYRRIINGSEKHLKDSGALFLEIGEDQATQVAKIAEKTGIFATAMVAKDYAEKNRVLYLKRIK